MYLPKSNILQTGGSVFGEISTKSKPTFCALSKASWKDTTPCCWPSLSINLTVLDLIWELILKPFLDWPILNSSLKINNYYEHQF